MNALKILLLLQILNVLLMAQSISSVDEFFKTNNIKLSAVQDSSTIDPYSFFPTHVGDFWQYSTAGDFIRSKIVTKDSLLNDSSRLVYYGDYYLQWPTYRIDTNYNVFLDPNNWVRHLYKLDGKIGDRWWIYQNFDSDSIFKSGFIGEVDTIYEGNYLNKDATFMVVSNYLVYNNFGVIEESWDSDRVLASGIGLIYEDKDGVRPDRLIAAIIAGDTLGTIVGVKDKSNSSLLKIFSLSQNYPNPFNSYTSIEYSIQEAGNYKFIIVNVLGEIVKTISEYHYRTGTYKIDLDFSELASGVYLGILTNRKTTKQIKMIYLK